MHVRPFYSPTLDNFVVIPKKEPNKFRLIHHLSFPKGGLVNDAIDPEACVVSYTSFDAAGTTVRGPLWQKPTLSLPFGYYQFTCAAFIFWVAYGWVPFMWIAACR